VQDGPVAHGRQCAFEDADALCASPGRGHDQGDHGHEGDRYGDAESREAALRRTLRHPPEHVVPVMWTILERWELTVERAPQLFRVRHEAPP
jgi:hypothetical protein